VSWVDKFVSFVTYFWLDGREQVRGKCFVMFSANLNLKVKMSISVKLDNWVSLNLNIQKHVDCKEIQEIISLNLESCRKIKTSDLQNLLMTITNNFKSLVKIKLTNEEYLRKRKLLFVY
jgi:hypothetical protein